jgi:Leucine-rich repeat (LRR) protein
MSVRPIPSLFNITANYVINNLTARVQNKEEKDLSGELLLLAWEIPFCHENKDRYSCLESTMNKIQDLVIMEEMFLSQCRSNGSYAAFIEECDEPGVCLSAISLQFSLLEDLKNSPIANGLRLDIENKYALIDNLFIEKCKSDGTFARFVEQCKLDKSYEGINAWGEVKASILQKNAHQLFSKLAKTCAIHPISTDFNVYKSWCTEQDQALKIFWSHPVGNWMQPNRTVSDEFGSNLQIETANKIRARITDPENTKALSKKFFFRFEALQLPAIPLEIIHFSNLTALYLNNNQIKIIPEALKELKELTVLELNSNGIKDISEVFAGFKNLKTLYLNDNQIEFIPAVMANSSLKTLSLNGNQIKNIPEVLAKSKITSLALCSNQIKEIPEEFEHSQLQYLFLGNNQIAVIPNKIARSQLDFLYLPDNQIKEIPEEFEYLQLTDLCLSNNQITVISKVTAKAIANSKLERLYLGGNLIKDVPGELGDSKCLKQIDLSRNPIVVIPSLNKIKVVCNQ